MKLCSVVLVAMMVAFVCVDAQKGGMGELFKKCGEESGIDMETIKAGMTKGNADGKLNCLFDCICKKTGIMKEDGSANKAAIDAITSKLPDKMKPLKGMLDGCVSSMKAGMAKCASAGKFGNCVLSKMPKKP